MLASVQLMNQNSNISENYTNSSHVTSNVSSAMERRGVLKILRERLTKVELCLTKKSLQWTFH